MIVTDSNIHLQNNSIFLWARVFISTYILLLANLQSERRGLSKNKYSILSSIGAEMRSLGVKERGGGARAAFILC